MQPVARRPPALVALALVACTALACGSTDSAPPGSGETDGDAAIGCLDDPRAQTYAPPMKVSGSAGRLSFVLVSAAPAPPQKGVNTWTVRVLDAGGQPVSGATLDVAPYMPDHGHGASVVPVVAPAGDAYTIGDLDFFMPGLWEVTIDAQASGVEDSGVFRFCVQG